jgi:secreted trypsin-like serine protease
MSSIQILRCLSSDEGQWFENQWGYITGFGIIAPGQLPDVMQYAEMRALSRDECNEQWPDQAGYFICAYSGISTMCSGDSGGGFAIFDNGAWRLVGSASMGRTTIEGQCDATWSSGFVRVAQHVNWIRSVME